MGQSRHLFSAIATDNSTPSSLLSALSGETGRLLGRDLRQCDFREGAAVWDAGSDGGQIFLPISGTISIRVPTRNGHGIEVATIGRERRRALLPVAPAG